MRSVSSFFSSSLAILFSLALSSPLWADGFIYIPDVRFLPPPPRRPAPVFPRPNFPLQVERHRVTADIDETVARTRVEESFRNPNDVQLEGTYIFPLPANAVVSSFSMKIGGKEVTGEILEKQRAREIYEQIVRQVRDPGLLEYVDRGLFRASVFPISARGAVDVAIEYSETLPRERGASTYRYPLDTGKYSAGEYRDVVLDIRLRSSLPIRTIHCPSHENALISRSGEREARASLEAKALRADKDFVLAWNVGEDALAPVVLTHRGSEPEGFFFFSISPRPERSKTVPPKDVVFVIDTSGSMLGTKLDQVKKALRYGLSTLNAGDRFNIIDFATEARRFRDSLTDATEENRKLAMSYVDELKARGGTNLEEGLRFGLSDLQARDRLQLAVLLTDGEPTVGQVNPAEIIRMVKEKNTEKRRVFVFGVGSDLNAKLLDLVASETRGATQYIRSEENLEVPLSNFFDKIGSPVLTELKIEFPAGGISDLYPRPLPDLFQGEQLEIFGRYQGDGQKTIVLRGKYLGEERVFEHSIPFPSSQNPFLPRLWAMRKIGYLLEQMRLSGESGELRDEVIRLSKRYGVITPYTSYLILEEDRLARRPADPGLLFQFAARDALSAPQATPAAKALRVEVEREARAFGADSGEASVEASRQLSHLKRGAGGEAVQSFVESYVNADSVKLKQLDEKTFYLQGSRWIDSALTQERLSEASVVHVKSLSDEYFRLLGDEPGIGKVLSVGPEATFLWKGKVIAIDA